MRCAKRIPGILIGFPAIVLAVFLMATGPVAVPAAGARQVIENPARPKAANAGRVVTPTEVLAITDEGTSDFYFYMPRDPKVAPDGSLLISDKDQILLFGADGRFRRNFFKKGQGPGRIPVSVGPRTRTSSFNRAIRTNSYSSTMRAS
jgi:hypothetical protein